MSGRGSEARPVPARRLGARRGTARRGAAWPLVGLLAAGALLAAGPGPAAGQGVVNHGAHDLERPNVMSVTAGFEYGFTAGIGYGRAFALGGRTVIVSGAVTAPWAESDTHDYDTRLGATIDLVARGPWRLIGGLGGGVRGTANSLSRMTSLSADGVLLAGHWSPRWFVTAEGGYDGAIATHVAHTEHYRARYFEDARDGWYVDTGANIRIGLAGGVSTGRYDIVLRAGQARDRQGHRQMLPAYATLGLNVRF